MLTLPMFAQEKPAVSEEPNVFKVNILSWLPQLKIEDSKFSGLTQTPEVRFYPKSNAVDGFYLAPYFRYQNFKLENIETNDKGTYGNYEGGFSHWPSMGY